MPGVHPGPCVPRWAALGWGVFPSLPSGCPPGRLCFLTLWLSRGALFFPCILLSSYILSFLLTWFVLLALFLRSSLVVVFLRYLLSLLIYLSCLIVLSALSFYLSLGSCSASHGWRESRSRTSHPRDLIAPSFPSNPLKLLSTLPKIQ